MGGGVGVGVRFADRMMLIIWIVVCFWVFFKGVLFFHVCDCVY